ncbi:probable salivary secreted peptide [Episyrphus balteatus]|uniref:probable salivary secreted peptide n=1 Tax=Episyrphus balteatus TaxID=286459 RepID=UPI002485BCFC|nr:probable salivary secreted peptide [Episyrphus balteatus]
MRVILLLAVFVTLVSFVLAAEYQWGEAGPKDYLMKKDKVKKRAIWGFRVTKKYVFKQKTVDALTITAIKAYDKKSKYDSTVELVSGGLGSKGVTLKLKSKRGKRIYTIVEIYGY